MHAASDSKVLDRAAREQRVVIPADSHFANLLAIRAESRPSLILSRRGAGRRPDAQSSLLSENPDALASDLDTGSVVVVEQARIRIRPLPFGA
jgi:predicted nuclease of predicted toxin-antitoxin system